MNQESALQKTICDYLRVTCPEVIFWHVPNSSIMAGVMTGLCIQLFGKLRGRKYAADLIGRFVNFLKSIGLLPGVPDLVLHWNFSHIAYIELKSETGKLSSEQLDLHDRLRAMGFKSVVVRTLDEFRAIVRDMRIPNRDAFLPRPNT